MSASLIVVLLVSVCGSVQSATSTVDVKTECNTQFVHQTTDAIVYSGSIEAHSLGDWRCDLLFAADDSQKDIILRLIRVKSTSVINIIVTKFKQSSQNLTEQVMNITGTEFNNQVYGVNTTHEYVQQLSIEFPHSATIVSLEILVTPLYKDCGSKFTCGKGCVSRNLVCDGYANCVGNEDEYCASTTASGDKTTVSIIMWWQYWYYRSLVILAALVVLGLLIGLTVYLCKLWKKYGREKIARKAMFARASLASTARFNASDMSAIIEEENFDYDKQFDCLPTTSNDGTSIHSQPAFSLYQNSDSASGPKY